MAVDQFGNFRGRESQARDPGVGGLIQSVQQQGNALGRAGQALQQAGAIWAAIDAKAQAEKEQRLAKQDEIDAIRMRQEYTQAISAPEVAVSPEQWPKMAEEMVEQKLAALDEDGGGSENRRFFWTKQKVLLAGLAREDSAKRQIEMNQAASKSLGDELMGVGDFEGAAKAMADLPEPVRAKALMDGRFAALDNQVLALEAVSALGVVREQVNARDSDGRFVNFPELDESKRNTLTRRINERENQVRSAQNRNSASVIRDVRQGVVFDEEDLRTQAAANTAAGIAPEDVDHILRLQKEVDAKRKAGGRSSGISSDPVAKPIKDAIVKNLLDETNPERKAFKEVFDQIEKAPITPEQKADLYELALRAREQDIRSDGVIHVPWSFNRDLSEGEQVFLSDYYRQMQERLRVHPDTSGFGDLFTEQEQKILKWFKANPKATEAQQKSFADQLKQESTIRISDVVRSNIWGGR